MKGIIVAGGSRLYPVTKIAWQNGWITVEVLLKSARDLGKNRYGKYLENLLTKEAAHVLG